MALAAVAVLAVGQLGISSVLIRTALKLLLGCVVYFYRGCGLPLPGSDGSLEALAQPTWHVD